MVAARSGEYLERSPEITALPQIEILAEGDFACDLPRQCADSLWIEKLRRRKLPNQRRSPNINDCQRGA